MFSKRSMIALAMSLPVMLIAASVYAGGSVKASAKFGGDDRPRRTVVKMDADAFCKGAHSGKIGTEDYLIDKESKAIENVIVYIKDGLGDAEFEAPGDGKVLDQQGCMYIPHVMTIQVGQTLTIKNNDDTLHNIHSFPEKQRPFNFAQPKKGDTKDEVFKREEIIKVKCDVHPWMSAYIGVFKDPYNGITGDDGSVTIEDVPAGKYTFAAWHEELGEVTQEVTVEDGKTAEVEFSLKK